MSEYIYLAHHGVKGQKWGVRRYQNNDGTLTDEGKRRYGVGTNKIFTPNVKQTAARSAKASVKASNKNAKNYSAASGVFGGVLAGTSVYALTMATGPASVAVGLGGAAVSYALAYAGETSAAAVSGYVNGAKVAHKQDKYIREQTELGKKVTLDLLTATSIRANYGTHSVTKTKVTSRKMGESARAKAADAELRYWSKNSQDSESRKRYRKTLSPMQRLDYDLMVSSNKRTTKTLRKIAENE